MRRQRCEQLERRLRRNLLVLDHLHASGVQGSGESGQKRIGSVRSSSGSSGFGNRATLCDGNAAGDDSGQLFRIRRHQIGSDEIASESADQLGAHRNHLVGDGERGTLNVNRADFVGVEERVQHQLAIAGTDDDVVLFATHFELGLTDQPVDFHDLQKQGVGDDGRGVGVLVLLVRVRSQDVGLIEVERIDLGQRDELADGDGLVGGCLGSVDFRLGNDHEGIVAHFHATLQLSVGNDGTIDGILLDRLDSLSTDDGNKVEAGTLFTGGGEDLGFKVGECAE